MAASFVLAIFGTLRLSRKAVVGFILLLPGRRHTQGSPTKTQVPFGAAVESRPTEFR